MGKFINTQYKETIDDITLSSKDFLNNPFYKFNDKKPTKTKYWNTNKDKSTLDPGSKLQQVEVGEESPTRFNLIEDLFIYGLARVEFNLENGDWGLEAEPITGEAYIAPNIIEPIPGDFFQVDYMFDGPWLFMVTAVDRDTFTTGANAWKITYRLERHEDESIKKNVVDEFVCLDAQTGTNFKPVVQKKKYFEAVDLDDLASTLKKYYIHLFFREPVQTFIYEYLNWSNMYDPYMIEFIIRNGILENNSSNYVHIEHQMPVPNTFSIDYDKTIYRAIELRDMKLLSGCIYSSQAELINSMISVFYSRYEDYFALSYKPIDGITPGPMNCRDYIEVFPQYLIYAIEDGTEITEQKIKYQNIFVEYFNKKDITRKDLEAIVNMNFEASVEAFYMIPFIIFVLEFYTKKLLS